MFWKQDTAKAKPVVGGKSEPETGLKPNDQAAASQPVRPIAIGSGLPPVQLTEQSLAKSPKAVPAKAAPAPPTNAAVSPPAKAAAVPQAKAPAAPTENGTSVPAAKTTRTPSIRQVDSLNCEETFADSINNAYFDGQTLRIEFAVSRLDIFKPNEPVTGLRLPVCRLVLSPSAAVDLIKRMQQIASTMARSEIASPAKQAATDAGRTS